MTPGRALPLVGTTRLAAVIGHPVRHSWSPIIHNAAFEACGLDWVYLAFDVGPGEAADALAAMRALGIEGLNVTMPHKADVAAAVDHCTATAAALGAVNCVARDGHRLIGHNTDGDGFVDSLSEETGFDPAGSSCVVVGAGGAARAVIRALADADAATVGVVNRTAEPARRAAALAGTVGRVVAVEHIGQYDLVVNATPVGMDGTAAAGQLPFPPERLAPHQIVADLVYEPAETPLVLAARQQGLMAINGVGMLVHQAARSFELWTNTPAPLPAMKAAVARQVAVHAGRTRQ